VTDDYQAGAIIDGRYRILGRIGGGGMANVYLAEDTTLGRRVAIKMLHRRFVEDAKFVERFRREAKAAAGLNHPNIVGVYDWGQVGSENYIVMEYVEGDTLKELIRRRGRLSGNEALAILLGLLAAVGAAHSNGVVHRDVKSQNILIDGEGRVKVADFGIAQAGDPGMTEAGSILGTAQYLAPEQARGEPVDERSDLYSVGVVLYEMLTGRVPFKGDSAVTVALKHVNELPPEPAELVPGLPYSLNQIVLKALAKDPNRRYGSAVEFAADLRAAQAGGPLRAATFDPAAERTQVVAPVAIAGEQATRVMSAPRGGAPARGGRAATNGRPPRRRRPPVWVILIILAALAAVAAGGVLIYNAVFGSSSGVPSVVGLTEQAAHDKLTEAGYKVARHDAYSDQFNPGFVSRQQPKAGTALRSGAIVDIWVSKGSTTVSLKDLTGLPAGEVADYLKTNGLVGDRRGGRSDAVAQGEVYKQSPPPAPRSPSPSRSSRAAPVFRAERRSARLPRHVSAQTRGAVDQAAPGTPVRFVSTARVGTPTSETRLRRAPAVSARRRARTPDKPRTASRPRPATTTSACGARAASRGTPHPTAAPARRLAERRMGVPTA